MKRTSFALLTGALLSTSLLTATTSFAQQTDMKAVESEVRSDLGMMGISTIDVTKLTLQQLQDIKLIESSSASNDEKKLQIEKLVADQPGALK